MSDAYFLQIDRVLILTGGPDQLLAKMVLPVGSYVITAKFTVGESMGLPEPRKQANISHYFLSYRDETDASYCDLRENGELKTVVLSVAKGLTGQDIGLGGGRLRPATVRLVCDMKGSDLEVAHISLIAISVDGVEKVSG